MKKFLIFIFFMFLCSGCCCNTDSNKYEIRSANGITLLYDNQTGFVWRNITCGNNNVPNCWELMQYKGAIVPDGEQKRRDKMPIEDLIKE